jgi:hypothetical protein
MTGSQPKPGWWHSQQAMTQDFTYKKEYTLKLTPVAQGAVTRIEQEIPDRFKKLKGIAINSDRPDLVQQRGTVEVRVGNIELREAGSLARFFQFFGGKSEVFRHIGPLDIGSSDRWARIVYTDRPFGNQPFQAHSLEITLFFD